MLHSFLLARNERVRNYEIVGNLKKAALFNNGGVAQMVDCSLSMREVPGSLPGASNSSFNWKSWYFFYFLNEFLSLSSWQLKFCNLSFNMIMFYFISALFSKHLYIYWLYHVLRRVRCMNITKKIWISNWR